MDGSTSENVDPKLRDRDSRIAALVAEYQAMLMAGHTLDRMEFMRKHADLAADLAPCLEALEYVGRVVPPTLQEKARPLVASLEGSLLGDFRVVRKIGSGGMGDVYEAEQISLQRKVAIKVLPVVSSLDERALKRFRHEAQAAAILQHPHIVPIYSVGNEGDVHYFAMQYIEGKSLAQVVSTWQSGGGLSSLTRSEEVDSIYFGKRADHSSTESPEGSIRSSSNPTLQRVKASEGSDFFRRVAEMFVHAAEALQHAHDVGIIHRDIKPGNLLIDDRGEVWIADFGLAKLPDSNLTGTTDFMGTLRYMSPEQASGRLIALDGRTDIYSLGVTLYETLTLEPAFHAEDRRLLLRRVIEEDARPLRSIHSAIPMDLETITLKAMAKEPEERYQSAMEFAEDLQRFLSDRPIQAKAQSLRQKSIKWMKRNRLTLGVTAATTVLFLVFGSIGLLYGLFAIDRQRKDLEVAFKREGELLREANSAKAEAMQRFESEKIALAKEQKASYLQAVTLAYMEYRSGNLEVAESLLLKCPVTLRDWEWRYVHQLCHREFNVVPVDTDYIADFQMLPSGELLLCQREGVSRWSLPDCQCLGHWPPFTQLNRYLEASLARDGKHVLRYSFPSGVVVQHSMRVEAGESGEVLWEAAEGKGRGGGCISPNGKFVLHRESNGFLKLWDLRSKRLVKSIAVTGSNSLIFSENDSEFAFLDRNGTLWIYASSTGELLTKVEESTANGGAATFHSLRFSPDGKRIALGCEDGRIRFFETMTGKSVQAIEAKILDRGDMAFSPDGLWMATMDHADHSLRIWNVVDGEEKGQIMLGASLPRKMQFSADGTILAVLTGNSTLSLWDLETTREGRVIGRIANGSANLSQSSGCQVKVSSHGKWAALCFGSRVEIYSLESHRHWKTLTAPHSGQEVHALSIDDSKGIVQQLTRGAILTWNLDTGTIAREYPIETSRSLSFLAGKSKDSGEYFPRSFYSYFPQRIFLAEKRYLSVDGTKWSKRSGSQKHYWCTMTQLESETEDVPYFGSIPGHAYCLANSPDGTSVAAAAEFEDRLMVWNSGSDRESWSVEMPSRTLAMQYSRQGDRLGVADLSGKLKIFETNSGTIVSEIAIPIRQRVQFAFSFDGKRVAIALGRRQSDEGEIWVSEVASGQTILKIPMDCAVESVDFTPDGHELLAADFKGRLWTFEDQRPPLDAKIQLHQEKRLEWHLERVEEAEWSKNYSSAIWHLDQMLTIQPNDESLANRRLAFLLKAGELATLGSDELEQLERSITMKDLSMAYRLSAEYSARQDWESHQRLCRRLIAQLNAKTKIYEVSLVYRLGTFCPHGVEDPEGFADKCVELFSGEPVDSFKYFVMGAAHYRAGHFIEAKTMLTKMMTFKRTTPSFAIGWLFLAMTEKALGNDALAEEAFLAAEKRFSEVEASRKSGEVHYIMDHHYPLLKNECKKLLERP